MEITGTTTMLKPVYSAPHPLAGEKVPLTVFDRAALDIFIPIVFAYSAPAPSNEALKEGLRRAVAPYPHLAGRLLVDGQGRRLLHLNNEGVLVIEATVPYNLADVLVDGAMAANVCDLYPATPEENFGVPLLQIKLNRYKCGGLVIGLSYHHHTADGVSMSNFITTWENAVREGKNFIAPSPFIDRATTVVPRRTPASVFDHRSIEFKNGESGGCTSEGRDLIPTARVKDLRVHFTAEFVAELKARVGGRCSTFQCLLAHVWKKITAVRGLQPHEFTQVRVAVDCRGRANPPVPMDFFGNMVLWAFPRLRAGDVLSWSYQSVVGAIRDAVARIDEEYIQSFVDFGTLADASGEELVATAAAGTALCPDAEVDSWMGLRCHLLNFGTGPPSVVQPPDLPIEGLMVFVPSPTAKGDVDLFMGVAEDQMEAFRKICYSFDDLLAARM
ncbi:tryptamine benzoyltransferase 1-like [Lolium perenne]|uniref:tryptamine benzoyltransferase 1-like n=1 Tax=Lolium perenne TaxID=4522 RepID=UPI0021F55280|nr:tryptamine benzoyltransferase 1-like [Lolium perenne]